jgi:hypothetical protein
LQLKWQKVKKHEWSDEFLFNQEFIAAFKTFWLIFHLTAVHTTAAQWG